MNRQNSTAKQFLVMYVKLTAIIRQRTIQTEMGNIKHS